MPSLFEKEVESHCAVRLVSIVMASGFGRTRRAIWADEVEHGGRDETYPCLDQDTSGRRNRT